jgi:hypothetical protein
VSDVLYLRKVVENIQTFQNQLCKVDTMTRSSHSTTEKNIRCFVDIDFYSGLAAKKENLNYDLNLLTKTDIRLYVSGSQPLEFQVPAFEELFS